MNHMSYLERDCSSKRYLGLSNKMMDDETGLSIHCIHVKKK